MSMTDQPDTLKVLRVALVSVFVLTATVAIGQDDLDAFVVAYLEVGVLQDQLDERLDEELERADLGAARFREIHETDAHQATESELAEYRDLHDRLLGIHSEYRERMVHAVESVDLSVDRFDEIVVDLLSDPEAAAAVEARIEEIVASRSGATATTPDRQMPGE
jgi:hypothetical protein